MNRDRDEQERPASLADLTDLPDWAHVRVDAVARLRGVSEPTVWRHVAKGLLPAPMRRGGITSWRVGDLKQSLSGD